MSTEKSLQDLERNAYRESYSDGIIDVFAGISLVWIGTAWIWLTAFAGLAGVLPAVLVTAVLGLRKQVVEGRTGYVRWTPPRRNWERRNLTVTFLAGVLLLVFGIGAFFMFDGGRSVFDSVGPAILAWLLALLATGMAFIMDAKRMLLYAAVLAASGVVAAATDANPGWPLLAAGSVMAVVGVAMLARYLQRYPGSSTDD